MDGFPINDFGLGQTELAVPSLACGSTPATAALPPSGQPGASPTACGTVGSVNAATDAPRRDIVSIQKCDSCHDELNFHGNHRVDSVQACTFCHNPEATDYKARQGATGGPITAANAPDGLAEEPIDLKFLVHRAHFQAFLNSQTGQAATYVVYHRGVVNYLDNPTPFSNANAGVTESDNCNACHETSPTSAVPTYYLPDPTSVIATTIVSNSDAASPAGKTAITPGTAACSTCHVKPTDRLHMTQNGGSFTATKDVNSQVVGGIQETCTLCHGPGAIADVKAVHAGIH
jgi:OmcA/MtrC family decaheme c-type cytochrome